VTNEHSINTVDVMLFYGYINMKKSMRIVLYVNTGTITMRYGVI